MKKLLYTLFAFAIIVACEKDMDDYNTTSINPIDAQVGISEKEAIDLLNSLLGEISTVPSEDLFYVAPQRIKGQANTARTSDGSCGDDRGTGNFITLTYFQNASERGVLIRSDESIPVAISDAQTYLELTYTLASDNTYGIRNEGTGFNLSTGQTPSASLLGAFGVNLNLLYRVNSANAPLAILTGGLRASAGIDCTVVTPPSADAWRVGEELLGIITVTHPTLGTYTLEEAPFPLTGWLATEGTPAGAAVGRSISNYAGTTSSSVMMEIQGDYEGN